MSCVIGPVKAGHKISYVFLTHPTHTFHACALRFQSLNGVLTSDLQVDLRRDRSHTKADLAFAATTSGFCYSLRPATMCSTAAVSSGSGLR